MILVDTSVWIKHFREGNDQLAEYLRRGQVLCHPFIVGELACGNLRNRDEILEMLTALPAAQVAEHIEVLHLVSRHGLPGHGIGWTDAHLLASTLLTGCTLWTLDRPLAKAAGNLKVSLD